MPFPCKSGCRIRGSIRLSGSLLVDGDEVAHGSKRILQSSTTST